MEEEIKVTQSFTLSLAQVAKLSDLSNRLGIKRSEVVRRAIDFFYEETNDNSQIQKNKNRNYGHLHNGGN